MVNALGERLGTWGATKPEAVIKTVALENTSWMMLASSTCGQNSVRMVPSPNTEMGNSSMSPLKLAEKCISRKPWKECDRQSPPLSERDGFEMMDHALLQVSM